MLRLLGPPRVVCGGRELDLGGVKPRAVLAALALRANTTVPTSRLAEQVWADPSGTVTRTLQVHVSSLRRALEPCTELRIVGDRAGYRLEIPDGALDLDRFEEQVGAGREALASGDAGVAARHLRAALELVVGAPLGDLRDVGDLAHAAARLDDAVLAAREDLAEAMLLSGGHRRLVEELAELAEAHPYRERFAAYRMWALYLAGRQAEALDVYARARQRLVEDLGVEPGPALERMHRDVLAHAPALDPRPSEPPASFLPRPAHRLVGREVELRRLTRELQSRTGGIVSVVGVGGCGKTRLAVEAARVVAPAFSDGVRFVDLAPLGSSEELGTALATALGIPPRLTEAAGTAVRRWLSHHEVLLVLDTADRLVSVPDELARVAGAAERSRVLVTSRLPLALRDQVELRLHPLPLPPDGADADELERSPAARLFLDRVRERRDLTLTPDECAAVVRICRRLDGLPLALELAAARADAMDVPRIDAELDDGGTLRTDGHDVPERQRTLGAALGWTIELLPDDSRVLLEAIGAFAGSGFDGQALAAVAPSGWDRARLRSALDPLLEAALLHRTEPDRYRVLETVLREARRRLSGTADADAVMARHTEHYLARIRMLSEDARTPHEPSAAAEVQRDRHELRAAVARCRQRGDHVAAADATLDLVRFWRRAGHVELEAESLYPLLEHVDELPTDRRFGVAWCAGTWFAERDRGAAERWLRLAVELAGRIEDPRPPAGVVLTQLAQVLTIGGREVEALTHAEDALAATERDGGIPHAFALFAAGWVHQCLGDRGTASALARASLAAAGTGTWRAWPTLLLSRIAVLDGRPEPAHELADEVRALAEAAGDRPLRTGATAHLGWAAHAAGDAATALRWWRETLCHAAELQRPFTIGNALQGVGAELASLGDTSTAVRLWGAADALQRTIGVVDAHENRALYGALRRRVELELGDHARTLLAAGGALSLDEAVALATGADRH